MLKFEKKTKETFVYNESLQIIDTSVLKDVKEYMLKEGLHMFRLCLHQSEEEQIQSMVLFFKKDFVMDYLWQEHGFVQYHVLEGKADLSIKDDQSTEHYVLSIDSPIVRFHAATVRRTIATSDFFIFSENQYGPFRRENTKRLQA